MPASPMLKSTIQFTGMSLIEFMISAVTYSSLGVALPYMVKELDWNWSQAGLGFTILGASCGASSLLPSYLIRVMGVRGTLMIGALGLASGLYVMSSVGTIFHYFVATALCGVSFQLMAWIPATFVITRLFRRRSLALGIYATIGGFGGVIGPWMVLLVIGLPGHGWRDYWLYQAIIILALGLLAAMVVGLDRRFARPAALELSQPEPEAKEIAPPPPTVMRAGVFRSSDDWTPREAFRTPQFYAIVAAYFANILALVTVTGFTVSHLVERGVATTTAAGMLSLEALVALGSKAAAGWIGDHFEPRYLVAIALGSTAIGCACLAGFQHQPWLLVYAVGTGIGFGMTQLCCTVLLLNYFGQRYNLELFSTMCLIGTLSAAGPAIGGVIRDATGSFVPVFAILSGVSAAAAIIMFAMRPPIKRDEQASAPMPAGEPAN
jgi:MFS family permease